MDSQQRGRSPSNGHFGPSLSRSHSPSSQAGFNNQAHAHGADPTLLQSGAYVQNAPGPQHTFSEANFLTQEYPTSYSTSEQAQQSYGQYSVDPQGSSFIGAYNDPNGMSPHSDISASVNPQFLDASNANSNQALQDFYAQNPNIQSQDEDYGILKNMQTSYNTVQNAQQVRPYSGSLSQPFDQAHTTHHGSHSRGQSLSPSSAAVPPGQAAREWGGIAFQGHRRNPSADAYSDLSSHHSPFVDAVESFDGLSGTSPNLRSQADPSLVSDSLGGLGDFSISDPNMIHSQHASPGHSAHVSPHMSPHQGFSFEGSEQFGMLASDPGPQMFEGAVPGMEEFPSNAQLNAGVAEGGANNDMETPQISIQFAPERQTTFNEPGMKQEPGVDALSPPSRSPSRQRGRAISDPYSSANMSRSSTPARQRAPSLGLHPGSAGSRSSRSPSPSGPTNGVQKPRDRASSTPSIPAQRDYMLGLADPERQQSVPLGSSGLPSSGNDTNSGRGRGQKHPATFQCSLCPKRFTRAYNLRSHLRTHTDERPFVCTVCGKAFARQHDRKRHEGLHSGEKKFVCKGTLSSASPWGCGRRFARADALGRHFRSEAGRACIKPLLEEEARERRAAMMEQANQEAMHQQQQAGGMQQPPSMSYGVNTTPMDMSGMTLPAALLAQYPALAGIQWDAMPPTGGQGGLDVDDGDFDDFGASGRSSYDASSGGELDFDDDGSFDPSVMGGSPGWNQSSMGQQMEQNSQMGQQAPQWASGYQGT